MKTKTTKIPDKVIELEYHDRIEIYSSKKKLVFHTFCDGTGSIFELTKEEIEELMK